jgi:hypothetical protein
MALQMAEVDLAHHKIIHDLALQGCREEKSPAENRFAFRIRILHYLLDQIVNLRLKLLQIDMQ